MSERAFTSHSFNQFLSEGQLMGTRCKSCGSLFLPPRPVCKDCHSIDMEWEALAGKGKLAAYSIINIAPTAMLEAGYGRDNPYCAAIVELEEGPSISAQILGVDAKQPESIKLGIPLELDLVVRGEGENARTFLAFKA
ncbi:MAG: Zn-ribbon domain-containing OB-fold protein [Anaerolineaceae bacterium]|nr:Zn-ribbon domain-containing OB-fold protein [Anaerolineaceae bacterium]